MDDYELDDDAPCPTCGEWKLRWRRCDQCDEGYNDLYDEDPLWYDPDDQEACFECGATGIQRWCSGCGWTNAGYTIGTEKGT